MTDDTAAALVAATDDQRQQQRHEADAVRRELRTRLAAACEAPVAEVVDDLPALAGPPAVPPPIAQGTRGVGATPPASPEVWLRQELVNARSR